jgi:hypothetical protein
MKMRWWVAEESPLHLGSDGRVDERMRWWVEEESQVRLIDDMVMDEDDMVVIDGAIDDL